MFVYILVHQEAMSTNDEIKFMVKIHYHFERLDINDVQIILQSVILFKLIQTKCNENNNKDCNVIVKKFVMIPID